MAPVGRLRFRKPQPIHYTNRIVINATNFGKSCIQVPSTRVQLFVSAEDFINSSEDCLFINIFSPSLNSTANLPVMLFIHGGIFRFGSSREYPGTQLALKDVVVVTFNYRLGVFGFLATDGPEVPGNVGIWDQILAMKWTKDNVRYFGGNPDDITLFGQSVGAVSVATHILSTQSQNLFQRAIIMSGESESQFSQQL